jgi:hypothetical protein
VTLFTGFWETRYTGGGDDAPLPELATTVGPITTTELLGRLHARLDDVPPGTWVRIDLIAWGDDE